MFKLNAMVKFKSKVFLEHPTADIAKSKVLTNNNIENTLTVTIRSLFPALSVGK